MKKAVTIICLLFIAELFNSCSKPAPPAATGQIAFWTSYDNGCGAITVTIDGANVGQISHWQTIGPSTCASSNTLLVASTTQGTKSVTFKNNCKTWTVSINLNSACYTYNLW